MQKRSLFGRLLLLATGLVIAGSLTAGAEELKIGAGAAPTENILKPLKASFEKASGLTLNVLSNGPKQAFIELEKGTVDAAAAGLAINDWWALLKKEGVAVANEAAYKSQVDRQGPGCGIDPQRQPDCQPFQGAAGGYLQW